MTRTQPRADATASRLRGLGHEAVVQPVLDVRPLKALAVDLGPAAALAFTSQNGVAAFAGLSNRRDLMVYTTGEATAAAARQAGFQQVEAADGDVQALAALIARRRPTGEVVWLSPAEPAGDLCGLLTGAGVPARRVPVYETIEIAGEIPRAIDGVLIHSPKAARVLARSLSPEQAANLVLFAISPAAAAPLQNLPFARRAVAAAPHEDALLDLLD